MKSEFELILTSASVVFDILMVGDGRWMYGIGIYGCKDVRMYGCMDNSVPVPYAAVLVRYIINHNFYGYMGCATVG